MFKEAKVSVLENVLDRAHRIGSIYTDIVRNKKCKSVIVRFTTFRHRTLFYRARNLKKSKVKLDLWKPRSDHLKKANYHAKEITAINFCHADVNCHLRVKFHDEKQEDIFSRHLKSFVISLIAKFKYTLRY